MKTTAYFDLIRRRADRVAIKDEWIERVVTSPLREVIQADGRIRRWAPIPEMDNAFFDRRFAS